MIVYGNLGGCKRVDAEFPLSLFTLRTQPPLEHIPLVLTEGCRRLSKSYSLVTGAIKPVETLMVSADVCLSEKCWALSKGKEGSNGLDFKNNLQLYQNFKTFFIFIISNHPLLKMKH